MESLDGWEVILNVVATVEQWDDANKRRVPVDKLTGVAVHWYDQLGQTL